MSDNGSEVTLFEWERGLSVCFEARLPCLNGSEVSKSDWERGYNVSTGSQVPLSESEQVIPV